MLTRLYNSCIAIRKRSPLSFGFLAIIYICVIYLIRGDFSADISSAIAIGVALSVFLLLYITSIYCTNLSSTWKIGISVILTILSGLRRYILQPTPAGIETTYLIVIGCTAILSLIGIRAIDAHAADKNLHDRIFHLIKHISVAIGLSILLGGGLSLGFLAIDSLFGIQIDGERYSTIRATSIIILGGISFIDGLVSGDVIDNTEHTIYKRQRILAGVVGFLLLVFGVILYTYIIKIVVTGTRPSNEVTLWAFIYCGLIIVASILLIPVRQQNDDRMYTIRQWMYVSIIPVCLVITSAISQRIIQYGVTMDRYLVIMCLLRVAGISLCIIIHKRFRVYWMFASLMIMGGITVFGGPLSGKQISYNSQLSRLGSVLESSGNLTNVGLTLPLENIDDKTKKDITSKINYIHHGLDKSLTSLDTSLDQENMYTLLGIKNQNTRENNIVRPTYMYFNADNSSDAIPTTGYSYIYDNIDMNKGNRSQNITLHRNIATVQSISVGDIVLDLTPMVEKLSSMGETNTSINKDLAEFAYITPEFALYPQSISIQSDGDDWILHDLRGLLLLK